MANDSLIEEMRAAIRGDRERAEQRRSSEHRPAPVVDAVSPQAQEPLADEVGQLTGDTDPEVARGRFGWLRGLRRRRQL
jgi:hypothetical protein